MGINIKSTYISFPVSVKMNYTPSVSLLLHDNKKAHIRIIHLNYKIILMFIHLTIVIIETRQFLSL